MTISILGIDIANYAFQRHTTDSRRNPQQASMAGQRYFLPESIEHAFIEDPKNYHAASINNLLGKGGLPAGETLASYTRRTRR